MIKAIIQLLMEHQGFVDTIFLSNALKQPVSILEREIRHIDTIYPRLLVIKEISKDQKLIIEVKIANYANEIAKDLLHKKSNR